MITPLSKRLNCFAKRPVDGLCLAQLKSRCDKASLGLSPTGSRPSLHARDIICNRRLVLSFTRSHTRLRTMLHDIFREAVDLGRSSFQDHQRLRNRRREKRKKNVGNFLLRDKRFMSVAVSFIAVYFALTITSRTRMTTFFNHTFPSLKMRRKSEM